MGARYISLFDIRLFFLTLIHIYMLIARVNGIKKGLQKSSPLNLFTELVITE